MRRRTLRLALCCCCALSLLTCPLAGAATPATTPSGDGCPDNSVSTVSGCRTCASLNCGSASASCDGDAGCQVCDSGFYMNLFNTQSYAYCDNSCAAANCPAGACATKGGCTSCSAGFRRTATVGGSGKIAGYTCVACPDKNCRACGEQLGQAATSSACTQCAPGYTVAPDGSCAPNTQTPAPTTTPAPMIAATPAPTTPLPTTTTTPVATTKAATVSTPAPAPVTTTLPPAATPAPASPSPSAMASPSRSPAALAPAPLASPPSVPITTPGATTPPVAAAPEQAAVDASLTVTGTGLKAANFGSSQQTVLLNALKRVLKLLANAKVVAVYDVPGNDGQLVVNLKLSPMPNSESVALISELSTSLPNLEADLRTTQGIGWQVQLLSATRVALPPSGLTPVCATQWGAVCLDGSGLTLSQVQGILAGSVVGVVIGSMAMFIGWRCYQKHRGKLETPSAPRDVEKGKAVAVAPPVEIAASSSTT